MKGLWDVHSDDREPVLSFTDHWLHPRNFSTPPFMVSHCGQTFVSVLRLLDYA